jgi:hypothetical protein
MSPLQLIIYRHQVVEFAKGSEVQLSNNSGWFFSDVTDTNNSLCSNRL